MTSEEFLERFNEGKISYKLPSKYPENFALCKTYNDGKREVPLSHKEKVEKILKDCYTAVKPVLKKFKLSLALLIESEVTYKGVAWTRKIKVNFSNPTNKEKKEELIAYTNMIQIKIRNKDHPQNPKLFLNRTTVLAIMLHELAHLRHMNHSIDFALFLQEIYQYAMTLGTFTENEEHMIPSSRPWERRMFETKGQMTREELDEFFKDANPNDKDDSLEHEHGEEVEKIVKETKKTEESKSQILDKPSENKLKAPLKTSNIRLNKAEVKLDKAIKPSTTGEKPKLASTLKAKTVPKTTISIDSKKVVTKKEVVLKSAKGTVGVKEKITKSQGGENIELSDKIAQKDVAEVMAIRENVSELITNPSELKEDQHVQEENKAIF